MSVIRSTVLAVAGAVLATGLASSGGSVASGTGPSVSVRVSGEVFSISNVNGPISVPFTPGTAIQLGDAFEMTYTFDASASDGSEDPSEGLYPASLTIDVGSYRATSEAGQISIVDIDESFEQLEVGASGAWTGSAFGDFSPMTGKMRLLDLDAGVSELSGDALPAGAPSLSGFADRTMFLQFEAVCDPLQLPMPDRFVCGFQGGRFWGYVFASVDSAVVVGGGDSDGDGVSDVIDVGDGMFDDGAGTAGAIADRGALEVTVNDAIPGGVTIATSGVGGPAVVMACGFPVSLPTGVEATITCGSITVGSLAGTVTVLLAGGNHVSVPAGSQVTIAALPGGGFVVENTGTTGSVISVTLGGVTTNIPSGSPARTTRPLTTDDCKLSGWQFYGVYATQGRCVSDVVAATARAGG